MDINVVVLSGRLTTDPNLRYTPNGVAVCQFTLATDRSYANAQGQRETDFHDCVAWRQKAETIANYVRKGQKVTVQAKLQTRYREIEGRKIKITEIVVDDIMFGEAPKGQGNNQLATGGATTQSNSQANHVPDFASAGTEINIGDEDLPF